jgi:hypothetical protein
LVLGDEQILQDISFYALYLLLNAEVKTYRKDEQIYGLTGMTYMHKDNGGTVSTLEMVESP